MEIFKHCTWDNPVFTGGLFWLAVFVLSGISTIYYKMEEKEEAAQKAKQESQPLQKPAKKPIQQELSRVEEQPEERISTTERQRHMNPRQRKAARRARSKLNDLDDHVETTPREERPEKIELTDKQMNEGWHMVE